MIKVRFRLVVVVVLVFDTHWYRLLLLDVLCHHAGSVRLGVNHVGCYGCRG